MTLKYTITNPIINNLARIESARAIVENAALVPLWERQFREEAMLRAVHHSTHVEGNPLSKEQAQKVLDGKKVYSAEIQDIQEVINYREVMDYIGEVYRDSSKPITLETITTVHRLLMQKILPPELLGRHRDSLAVVKNSTTGATVFTPPPPEEIPQRMDEFIKWLWRASTEDLPAVIKAGIIHYQLVYIHPFYDGNGRTARALSTLSLYKDRYDIRKFFCLDEYFDLDSLAYYAALRSADQTEDLTTWLEYFSFGLAEELEKVRERVLKLSRDARLRKVIGQIALNERQEQIMLFIERYGRIANKDWRQLFPGVSDDTVLRDIKFLVEKRMLVKRGKTKAAFYEMS